MEKILLLQLNRLGDLVQTVPLLRQLRSEYPDSEITLVCQLGIQEIVADCGYFDRLVALSKRTVDGLSDRTSFVAFDQHPEFRETYDLAINLASDLGAAILTEKIAAKRKQGRIHTHDGEIRLLGLWAKYLFAMVTNRLDNLFNIVDIQAGIAGLQPAPQPNSLPVSAARAAEAVSLLDSNGRKGGRRLIAFQTGASQLHRAWALENFAELSCRLLENDYAEIVLVGDAGERERAENLQSLVPFPLLNLVGKTSLVQLPAILAECDLLVSNDTGTIHIAAAVATPTLGLFFSTAYFSETAPYGAGHAILQVEIPCAPCHASAVCPVQICRQYLPPEAVYETTRWLLDGSESPTPRPNLSLYLSRFLANGSMIYLPVHPEVSKHYFAGLIGRQLWEGVLGLERDRHQEEIWNRIRHNQDWEKNKTTLAATFESLATTFSIGLNLASKLRSELEGATPIRARIVILHRQLSELGATMANLARDGGLFGDFLKYEMMDLDYAPYPEIARNLEAKYQKLSEWTRGFRDVLVRLSGP